MIPPRFSNPLFLDAEAMQMLKVNAEAEGTEQCRGNAPIRDGFRVNETWQTLVMPKRHLEG